MKSELSEFIKLWREKNNYSQGKLGLMLKITGQQVSNIERDIHKRPVSFVKKLLKFMNQEDRKTMKNLLYKELLKRMDGIFK